MKTTINSLKLVLTVVLFLTLAQTKAQLVGINTDGSAPNTNALLDIKSSGSQGRGLLIPRITLAQRTVASTNGGLLNASSQLHGGAAQGLIVYQTDGTQGFYYNTSTTATPSWSYLSAGTSGVTGPTGAAGANGAAGAAGATGPTGAAGVAEAWLTGSTAPTGGQGAVGDWYFRTSNNEILEKTASTTWTSRSTIVGATGATGAAGAAGPAGPTGAAGAAGATGTSENWISGATAPTGGQGVVGDWYYNTATNTISEKTAASTWTTRATITGATGATGAAGTNGTNGATGAAGATGPAGPTGAAGAVGLTGASENWISGATAPTGGQGAVGDWYYNTATNTISEKTATTTWTSRATITGATGATGAAGTNGTNGVTGPAGAAGTAGPTGPTGAAGAVGVSENWISGAIAPTGGQGAVGDWYYNTATNTISEKTAVSTWTTRATITGATGATGAAGTNGTNGVTGPAGAAGTAGPTGPTGPAGSASGWNLTGNASTNPSTNFIGTTDSRDFIVRTNGTERMRVTSAGNIGIGTTTPSKALDVVLNSSGTNVVNIRNTNVAGYSSIDYFDHSGNQMCNVGFANTSAGAYAGTMYFATNADVDMTWAHNNSEVMRLATGGMLGIGTSSPSEKLDVIGHIKSGATTDQEGGQFMLAEPSLAGTGNWVIDNFFSYSGGNKFRFWNDRTGASPLNIIDNGYVGIGAFTWDAQPSTTLHVKGSVRIEDGTQGAGKVLTSDADGNANWQTPAVPSTSPILTSTSAAISGTNNDYNAGSNTYFKFNNGTSTAFTLSSITGGTEGKMIVIQNSGTGNMTIRNNAGGTAANRIITGTGADLVSTGTGSITLIYDSTQSRWVVISFVQ